MLKLNFDYGTTDNNGNVKSQQIAVPAIGGAAAYTATQVYTYDSLNRIKQATETIPAQTGWQQTFVYDRYGNRRFDAANTTTLAPGCAEAVCNPQIDPATNKLIGYQFDDAGNTRTDASGQTFIYDSENKQVQVNNAGGTVGQYFYNGDGQRVKKVVPSTGETTIFVYDAASKLVAEYSTQVEPASTAKITYLTNDHLGSPRITTDALGNVISRRDFRPFGEEIARAGYGADSVRQKFTGYARDIESELDFAQARMFANRLGRFTSVDAGAFTPADPQNFNRYLYVQNNPLKYKDPSGNDLALSGDGADDFLEFLRKKSGLDLTRDAKTGKISIAKGSKRNETGTSKEFAKLLKNIIGGSEKLSYDVVQNDKTGPTLYDDAGKNVVDTKKQTLQGFVDFGDIKETDKQAPELATTVVAHFLYEGQRLAAGAPFTGDSTKGFSSLEGGAHLNALVYETKIMSEYTGQNEKLAERRDVDNPTINFIYTSVQYDVTLKSTSTNAMAIDKITRTAPMRKPQYPPGN